MEASKTTDFFAILSPNALKPSVFKGFWGLAQGLGEVRTAQARLGCAGRARLGRPGEPGQAGRAGQGQAGRAEPGPAGRATITKNLNYENV